MAFYDWCFSFRMFTSSIHVLVCGTLLLFNFSIKNYICLAAPDLS